MKADTKSEYTSDVGHAVRALRNRVLLAKLELYRDSVLAKDAICSHHNPFPSQEMDEFGLA